jgi:hypothetical protein
MKKISEKDGLTLRMLADEYGAEFLISELKKFRGQGGGRPSDLVLNTAILWAHIEFFRLHRVVAKTKKLESACALLAGYLNRYTAGARRKSETTLLNIYKRAPKAAITEPLVGLVMKDAFAALLHNLRGGPHKVPIPYLIQGTKSGWKFPVVDRSQFGDNIEIIGSNGPNYSAAFSMIVTPKNN